VADSPKQDRREEKLIQDLVPDPAQVPEARMLLGMLGRSSREGFLRLYLTTELKDYVEIDDSEVLLTRSLMTPENPLGGTAVWVRADANIEVTRRASEDSEEAFLTGEITARFFSLAAASGTTGTGGGGGGGIKSVPPVESCVPSLCMPPPPPPDPPGTTAVCTLSTKCGGKVVVA
jgi:hypothetical protein